MKIINLSLSRIVAINLGILFFMMLSTTESKASHIVGGNITYRYLGGNGYQIKLTLRRDCFLGAPDAQFDDPAFIGVFGGDGTLVRTISAPFMSSDTLNEYIQSDCGFEGTQVCVHETTYLANVTLPFRPGGYIIAYQRCCRNMSLNNVTSPDETGATYWVNISEQALLNRNSSPNFKDWPPVYICNNAPIIFDHSATDIDGDSLVYKLITPNSGATKAFPQPNFPSYPPFDFINFAPPYSLEDMMGGVPVKIDRNSGEITGTPNLVGQFLIGIAVEEYRNGVLLSTVRRDFQYNVRVCSQPPLAQFTTSETNCDGLTVSFFNNSLAASNFQWDFDFPNPDPNFKSTLKDPTFTYPESGIYTVRLRATRGSDGCFDTLVQQVAVFTNKIDPNFGFSLGSCQLGDSIQIQLTDSTLFDEPGFSLNNWEWTVTQNGSVRQYTGQNPLITVNIEGEVSIHLYVSAENSCSGDTTLTLNPLDFIPEGDFIYELDGCTEAGISNIKFTNTSQSQNPYGVIDSVRWTIGSNEYFIDPVVVGLPSDATNVGVQLRLYFNGGCEFDVTKNISIAELSPQIKSGYRPVECPTDSTVTISLFADTTMSLGIPVMNVEWEIQVGGFETTMTGDTVIITVPKDSIVSYTLVAYFENGCIDSLQVSFLPGPFATIQFAPDPIVLCPNQERTFVINGNPDWTYIWTPVEGLDLTEPSNPIVSVKENTTYSVTVSDGLCSIMDSVTITALQGGVDLVASGDTTTCNGEAQLIVTGGIGEGTYTWGTDPNVNNVVGMGDTINVISTELEQTYYVQYVGEACSTMPAQITVVNQTPQIESVSPFKLCREDTTQLLTINLVPSHQNSFVWDSDPHIISGGNTATPTIGIGSNENGTLVFYYTVTNQYECIFRDSFVVNIVDNPVVDFSFDLSECGEYKICFEEAGNYTGFIRWEFGDPKTTQDFSLMSSPCYTYDTAGTYIVTLQNLVNVCPFDVITKEVVVNPPLTINEIQDTIVCLGDTVRLMVSGNILDVNYNWYNANFDSLTNTTSYTTVVNTNLQYYVVGKDTYGCQDTIAFNVSPFTFDYQITTGDSLCINQNSVVNLNIANPENYSFEWTPVECIVSGGNTNNPTVKAVADKKLYVHIVHLSSGCEMTDSIAPKITQPFTFQIEGPGFYCLGQDSDITLTIANPENYNYLWSPAECFTSPIDVQNPTVNLQTDKILMVTITDKVSGCQQNGEILAEVGEVVTVNVNADPDFTIFEGEEVELFIENPVITSTYEWSTGETTTSIVVSPIETTSYSVTVTDENGCTAVDEVTVTVRTAKCDETDVFIPSAFTPNGDGTNDILYVRSNFIESFEIIIYNRWGQEVFRSNNQDIGWDGTFKGDALPPDSYAYYLKVICVNVQEYSKKGNVSIIR